MGIDIVCIFVYYMLCDWRFKWQRKKVFIMLTTKDFYKQ